jgi:tetratricopeptide (TPR) repeat protein
MPRVEKTVFISYRRTNFYTALAVYQDLTAHGYDVFFDYQSIDSGNFSNIIIDNIRARAHFLVVLSPSALERCNQPGDWLRREIETAMDEKRNIIPLMMEGFDFGSTAISQALSGKLADLKTYNGLRLYADYFFDGMEKLRARYLNVALDYIHSHELSDEIKQTNEENKTNANQAAPVEADQLTAEEWFERGYVFQQDNNFDEAIRCYTESIHIQPDKAEAHSNLAIILQNLKRYKEAEASYREAEVSYRKAIELNPPFKPIFVNTGSLLVNKGLTTIVLPKGKNLPAKLNLTVPMNTFEPFVVFDVRQRAANNSNLGTLLQNLKRYEEAEASYRKAIELNPSYAPSYSNLGNLLKDLKRYDEAEASYRKAIELNPLLPEAYYNLGNLLKDLKRYEEAEASYRKAIELNPSYATSYYNLGNLLKDLKRYEEAEASYRKAIELNPSYATFYNNLMILLRVTNKERDALTVLEKLIEIDPENFNSYLGIASIKKTLGEAIDSSLIEKARQYIPEDDFYNRACLESVCDNFDLAFEYLRKTAQQEGFGSSWAWEDPDLQWIRDDPRFVEIVGPKPEK